MRGDKDAKRLVPTEQEGERGNGSMAASRAHVFSAACCSFFVDADSRSWKSVGRRSAAKEENLEMLQGVSSLVALIEVVLRRFPALSVNFHGKHEPGCDVSSHGPATRGQAGPDPQA